MLITATKIHDGKQWMPPGTLLEVSAEGTIERIPDPKMVPPGQVKKLEGIICPGFVNVHCHLELSYLRGQVPEATGLVPFLTEIMRRRYQEETPPPEMKKEALEKAISEMRRNGIVAVGDIANTNETIDARLDAGLHIHTFVEAIGLEDSRAEKRFDQAAILYREFKQAALPKCRYQLRQSIVPHAPYSISRKLFSLIDQFEPHALISVHNQETAEEEEWYQTKTGAFSDFFRQMRIDDSSFVPSGQSSVRTYVPWLSAGHPLLLIHNTFMNETDYLFLAGQRRAVYLGLCPGANQYIEQKLPPLSLFKKKQLPVCLGTDSLASNWELSIFAEMHRLKAGFPDLDWETLIRWGTFNGAAALEMDDHVGHIAPGKKPGLIHIGAQGYQKMTVLFNA